MKSFCTFLLVCLSIMTGFSQDKNPKWDQPITLNTAKVVDNVIVYSTTASNMKYTYTYDALGNNTLRLDKIWLNESWTDKARYNYTYNEMANSLLVFMKLGLMGVGRNTKE